MPGIRVKNPVGTGWDYSLDGQTWQSAPVFNTKADGSPFVEGTAYVVHCRHNLILFRDVTIIFGEPNSEPLFDEIVKRGKPARKGWTNFMLFLMGGITALLPTTTDQDMPTVVIDASGKLWKRGGKLVDYIRVEGPSSFPINQIGTFLVRAYYSDGTSALVSTAAFSVQGQDATIGALTGKMVPGPNAIVMGPYTVTATYQGKTHSKGTTLTAASLKFKVTGAPKYFEAVGTLGPNYDGSIDELSCLKITGWVADLNHPDTPASARLYINGIFVKIVTAHKPRPDVSTVLGLTNSTGHIYGFEESMPAVFQNGQPITVELRPVSGTNAFRFSPKTTPGNCVNISTLINVAQGKTVSADLPLEPSVSLQNLTDGDLDSFFSSACYGTPDLPSPYNFSIDLNGTAAVQLAKIQPRTYFPNALPVDFIIYGSLDNVNWVVLATVTGLVRTYDEIIIPFEKDLSGNFFTVRYVRTTVTKTGSTGVEGDCWRVQMAGMSIMAASLTPIGSTTPAKTPQSLLYQGEDALSEGTNKNYKLILTYTDQSTEDVTAPATISYNGTGVTFEHVGQEARLTALANSTSGDTRTVTLKAFYMGLSAMRDITVYDSSVTRYRIGLRIDRLENVSGITEGGAPATYFMTGLYNAAPFEEVYQGAGSYSVIEPYPNGMTFVTQANARCLVTLPLGSITADLTRVLRFTLPAGGGYVEKDMPLINVPDAVSFSRYDMAGDDSLQESQTEAVTKTYQVVEVYSDDSTKPYTGSGSFTIDGQYPDGMSFSSLGLGAGSITLPANKITGNVPITLRYVFAGNGTITKVVQLLNVASPTTPNTTQSVAYRFIKGGSVAGQPTDYIEVIMGDTYPESPMTIQLWLASSATPKSGYKNFERKTQSGAASSDGKRHAYWEEIGVLANKSFKIGITMLSEGNAGNPNLFTFSFTTTGVSTDGFIQLYPTT